MTAELNEMVQYVLAQTISHGQVPRGFFFWKRGASGLSVGFSNLALTPDAPLFLFGVFDYVMKLFRRLGVKM